MSGQMGILIQFKASGPNLGAGWSGGDDERGGRYPPCMHAACAALQGGSIFLSDPKSFGDFFWGGRNRAEIGCAGIVSAMT